MDARSQADYEARRAVLGPDTRSILARVLPELRRGGVILLPVDTIYGLSCRWDSEEACARVQALKGHGRPATFVSLVAGMEMTFQYAERPGPAGMRILEEQWPGPVTAVLRARPTAVPTYSTGSDGTVAFRWPRNGFLEELIRDLGVPIVSTSANRTGEEHATSASAAWRIFGEGVDLYVDGGQMSGPASTLVDLTGAHPHLLRLGGTLPGRTAGRKDD